MSKQCPRGSQAHRGRCISIDRMIDKLGKRINGEEKFFHGNCGNFAIALKRVLGGGELVGVYDEHEYDGLSHVAYKLDGIYYDGDGALTKTELKENEKEDHPSKKIEIIEGIDEDNIVISAWHISADEIQPEWFEKQIRKEMDR